MADEAVLAIMEEDNITPSSQGPLGTGAKTVYRCAWVSRKWRGGNGFQRVTINRLKRV